MGVIVLLLLILIQSINDIDFGWLIIIGIPVASFLVSFGLFSYIVERFLNKRIKLIYRIISNRKLEKDSHSEYSISEDILGKLTEDTAEWAQTQKDQIQELEEQAAFRKEFLGNLAHELKTPVFSIQGYVLTLLEGGLEDEGVNRDFLERALNGVDRISTLLEDLDAIARFETDRFNLKVVRFDILDMAKKTFQELETKAQKKNISFEFNKSYDPIYVKGDKAKITQVLTNLISNSISYGNEGGMTTVRFHELSKKQVLIEVADDGLGMDEKHLPRLFERFYRVDKSRERNVGGSGLGLAISKHIIEAHGQSIDVRSTEGVGSTFSFTLELD